MNPKLRSLLNAISRRLLNKKIISDFDWQSYTATDYKQQYEQIMKDYDLLIGDLTSDSTTPNLDHSRLVPPLKDLYAEILKLQPKSILEVGAGNGINLINLGTLLPEARILGIELLLSQIELGKNTFPNFFKVNIRQGNFLEYNISSLEKFEVVFTNAVVMHLSSKNAKKMIGNLVDASDRYVLMHENIYASHNFPKICGELSKQMSFKYEIIFMPNSSGLIKLEKYH